MAQAVDGQETGHGLPHQWKHLTGAGVEEQWLLIHDDVLVERELARALDLDRRVDSIDPVSDLMSAAKSWIGCPA